MEPLPSPANSAELVSLRRWCLIEAITLLLLVGIAVPLKYAVGWRTGVSWMGPLHGLAFVGFCWTALHAWMADELPGRTLGPMLLFACIPLGGFYSWYRLGRRP